MPKIVHLAEYYWPHVGGIEVHLEQLCAAQQQIQPEFEHHSITRKHSPDLPDFEIYRGVNIHRMALSQFTGKIMYKLAVWRSIWRYLALLRSADRIHVHDVFWWLIPFLPFLDRNKLFITFHGYEGDAPPGKRQQFWHKVAAHCTKGNLCIGDFHRTWYQVEPTYTSYGAVELPKKIVHPVPRHKRKKTLIFVGRLEADTGITTYLKAARILAEQHTLAKLDIFGDGSLRQACEEYIEKHHLPVTIHGFTPDVAYRMSEYDCAFVSRYLSILEALVRGVPVVAEYHTAIKYDYLALAPFASWITLVTTPQDIVRAVLSKQPVSNEAIKWARKQSWRKMATMYAELWGYSSYPQLNLGCGLDKRKGWINIDAVEAVKPDLCHDLTNPLPFESASIGAVLAQDILEHFTKEDGQKVIAEISRVLVVGGTAEVRVPNVDAIITQFASDTEVRNEFLYGTTAETGVFGAHKVGFTVESLVTQFALVGLELTEFRHETTNIWARFSKVSRLPTVQSVTVLTQSLVLGGAEVFLTDLCIALHQQGIRVRLHTTNKTWLSILEKHSISGEYIPVVVDLIGNWKGFLKALLLSPKAFFVYARLLGKERSTDVIVVSNFSEKLIVSPLATIFGKPVVWFEFGPLGLVLRKFFSIPKLLYFLVKQIPMRIVVPSKHTKLHLISEARVSLAQLAIVPCGRILPPHTKSRPIANRIVCLSRLEPGKGQDLLIRAMPTVLARVPTAELYIIGTGDFEPALRSLANDLGVSDAVFFAGYVPDQLAELGRATVCAFPSIWPLEGFGLVLIEALALGTPVVAFNRSPINEIITDEETGLLVSTGNVEELAEALVKVLTDATLRRKLSSNGKKQFKQKFAFEHLVHRYIEILRESMVRFRVRKMLQKNGSYEG